MMTLEDVLRHIKEQADTNIIKGYMIILNGTGHLEIGAGGELDLERILISLIMFLKAKGVDITGAVDLNDYK